MTDYSKMSDQKINEMVAIELGEKIGSPINGLQLVEVDGEKISSSFDPCNNPADAWPIIVESGIGFYRIDDAEDSAKDMIGEWHATGPVDWAYGESDSPFDSRHKNPLRAAMIVLLMMKDADNV